MVPRGANCRRCTRLLPELLAAIRPLRDWSGLTGDLNRPHGSGPELVEELANWDVFLNWRERL